MKLLTTSLVLAMSLQAMGDVFTLNDGTTLNADVIKRTSEEYVLDVYVTKSIKERKTIKRSEIKNVEVVSASKEEFKAIANLAPAPPYLPLEDYDARIKKLKAFAEKHKVTTAATKAIAMRQELEEEREAIAAGGVKTSENTILNAEERASDIIRIESQPLLLQFRELVEARSYIPALRKYEELEGQYAASQAHRDALPLFKKLLKTYQRLITQDVDSFDAKRSKRETALSRLSESDQNRAASVENARLNRVKKIRAREAEQNIVWLSVDTQDKQSLISTERELLRRLEGLPKIEQQLANLPETGALFQEGWAAAGEKNATELEPILDELKKARVSERITEQLVARYDAATDAPAAEEKTDEATESEENADTDPSE